MKKIKHLVPALVAASFIFSGCGKDDDNQQAEITYLPTTANSTWTYNVHNNINAAADFNFTIKSLGTDTTAADKPYKIFTNTSGSNEYYTHTGTSYYQFGSFQDLTNAVELNYLKSDASAGATWMETKPVIVSGLPINATFKYTLVKKLPTYVVNTVTFNNVLQVKVELAVTGLVFDAQELDFYYAEGVGRIKSNIKLKSTLLGVDIDTETTLTSYTIVP